VLCSNTCPLGLCFCSSARPRAAHVHVYLWSPEGLHTVLVLAHRGAAQVYMFLHSPTGGGCALFQHSPTGAVFLFRRSPMGLRTFIYICGRRRGSTLFPHLPIGGLRNCIYSCTRPLGELCSVPTLAHWGCVFVPALAHGDAHVHVYLWSPEGLHTVPALAHGGLHNGICFCTCTLGVDPLGGLAKCYGCCTSGDLSICVACGGGFLRLGVRLRLQEVDRYGGVIPSQSPIFPMRPGTFLVTGEILRE